MNLIHMSIRQAIEEGLLMPDISLTVTEGQAFPDGSCVIPTAMATYECESCHMRDDGSVFQFLINRM